MFYTYKLILLDYPYVLTLSKFALLLITIWIEYIVRFPVILALFLDLQWPNLTDSDASLSSEVTDDVDNLDNDDVTDLTSAEQPEKIKLIAHQKSAELDLTIKICKVHWLGLCEQLERSWESIFVTRQRMKPS